MSVCALSDVPKEAVVSVCAVATSGPELTPPPSDPSKPSTPANVAVVVVIAGSVAVIVVIAGGVTVAVVIAGGVAVSAASLDALDDFDFDFDLDVDFDFDFNLEDLDLELVPAVEDLDLELVPAVEEDALPEDPPSTDGYSASYSAAVEAGVCSSCCCCCCCSSCCCCCCGGFGGCCCPGDTGRCPEKLFIVTRTWSAIVTMDAAAASCAAAAPAVALGVGAVDTVGCINGYRCGGSVTTSSRCCRGLEKQHVDAGTSASHRHCCRGLKATCRRRHISQPPPLLQGPESNA